MKPNFALTLSFDGIGLLHRAHPGWHLVGDVALDSADLAGDATELRNKALALDPSGLSCKIVIPNEQIRYLSFDDEGMTGEALSDAVRQALDGATPYALDDLVYNWSVGRGRVHVAAVARETLDEAEAFAVDHQFNPLSFVAIPDDGQFVGEPFFGLTEHAGTMLPNGEKVDRDAAPIQILGASRLPEPDNPEIAEEPSTTGPEAGEAVADAAGATGDPAPDTEETAAHDPVPAFTSIRARRENDRAGKTPDLAGPAPPVSSDDGTTSDRPSDAAPAPPARALSDSLRPSADDGSGTAFLSRRKAGGAATVASPPPPTAVAATSAEDEAQNMAIFGTRDAQRQKGSSRRLGLILTAILLLFLIGVAAWASIFMDDRLAQIFRSPEDAIVADRSDDPGTIETAEPDTADPPQENELAAEDPDPQVQNTGQIPEDIATAPRNPETSGENTEIAALPDSEIAPDEAEAEQAGEAANTSAGPDDETPDTARTRYAATGIWQVAPEAPDAPRTDAMDDFYQTSIDSSVEIQDAVALPDAGLALPDSRPSRPLSPPDPDTEYDLDDRGLVTATPDGALTPDGIEVFSGPPPVTPPRMPDRPETARIADMTADTLRLATIRPRVRPDDLIEQNERGAFSGRTRTELAALRPRLRPQSAQEAAEQARQGAEVLQATVVDSAAVDEALSEAVQGSDPFADATPQAVSASLKPNTRPSDFENVVQQAQSSQEPQAVETASAAQATAPSIPSSASVAQQATQRNALKLRRVNLIGVYGSPGNRRALVRLANGRYQKVQVGDRLNGGRVAAIGDTELQYTRNGRNVVLKMPQG